MTTTTTICKCCQANEQAAELRKTEYMSDAHKAALKLTQELKHEGCLMDPRMITMLDALSQFLRNF
jgi:hypothetical protein